MVFGCSFLGALELSPVCTNAQQCYLYVPPIFTALSEIYAELTAPQLYPSYYAIT